MLFISLFLSGFTLGVIVTLAIFAPEKKEEAWDPQHFPKSPKRLPKEIGIVVSGERQPNRLPKFLSPGLLTKVGIRKT